MSTIVAVAEQDVLVLGTDSRFVKTDFSSVVSDATEKIIEVAPDTFIATTGWSLNCDFHARRAHELARELDTSDIRVLADALDRESGPVLRKLLGLLSLIRDQHERISGTLSGQIPLAGFVLAGRVEGKLGFLYREYWVQGGNIAVDTSREVFEPSQRMILVTNSDRLASAVGNVASVVKADRPIQAVKRILGMQRQNNAETGGLDQVVLLDQTGSHWIERPAFAYGSGLVASAIGTQQLYAGEILVGQGTGKPSKFKVVDTGGTAIAFLGSDSGGNFNWFQDIRIGPDINAPTIYGSSGGVVINGATFTLALNGVTTEISNFASGYIGTVGTSVKNSTGDARRVAVTPGTVRVYSTDYDTQTIPSVTLDYTARLILVSPTSGYSCILDASPLTGSMVEAMWLWGDSSAWGGGHLVLGSYHFWVDAAGNLRMKSGAPTSDLDGTKVGSQ